jgi:adenylyltransferase and sulfurtransferase
MLYIQHTIGRIGIIDHDSVEISNLQRQILHSEQTIGMHKTESAAKAIQRYAYTLHHSLQLPIHIFT